MIVDICGPFKKKEKKTQNENKRDNFDPSSGSHAVSVSDLLD